MSGQPQSVTPTPTRVDVRRSPLSDEELSAIAHLYGPADAKYADRAFLKSVYDAAPYGGSFHAFAREGEDYVGHVSVIPLPALVGGQQVASGKYEAFAVADTVRSAATEDGAPVAVALLASVTEAAEEHGIQLLHGVTNDQIGMLLRVAGCRRIPLSDPTYAGVVDAKQFQGRVSGWRRYALSSSAVFARFTSAVARAGARALYGASATVVDPVAGDATALRSSAAGWTVDPAACWEWLERVGDLRVLSIRGRKPSRVLVRPPRSEHDDLHVVGWCEGGSGATAALIALAHARKLGYRARALHVQCWQPENAAAVGRACRLLGFVPRPPGAFYVRSKAFEAGTAGFNPFFYAMF